MPPRKKKEAPAVAPTPPEPKPERVPKPEALHIMGLRVENFKRVVVVEMEPNRHLQVIGGGNGAGKSSTLDALMVALTGTKNLDSIPVREGAQVATIRVAIGDGKEVKLRVQRKFIAGSKTPEGVLTVTSGDYRSKYNPAQGTIDQLLLNHISFDPVEFMRMGAREQVGMLETIARLDFADQQAAREQVYDERTQAKKDSKELLIRQREITVPEGLPKEVVDVVALGQQIAAAGDANLKRAQTVQEQAELQRTIHETNEELLDNAQKVQELEAQLVTLHEEASAARETVQLAMEALEDIEVPAAVDVAPLQQQMRDAETINRGIGKRRQWDDLARQIEAKKGRADELGSQLTAMDAQLAREIAEAKMPVDGLGVRYMPVGDRGKLEGEVMYNQFPLRQASSAEQIRVSVAIGMAVNPTLRVLRIKDGSLLDKRTCLLYTSPSPRDA
jgi:DNA repair exonuclease SbcCD ATPase subunit